MGFFLVILKIFFLPLNDWISISIQNLYYESILSFQSHILPFPCTSPLWDYSVFCDCGLYFVWFLLNPVPFKTERNASSSMMPFLSSLTKFDLFILWCLVPFFYYFMVFWLLFLFSLFVILIDSPFSAVFSTQKPLIKMFWVNCESLNIGNAYSFRANAVNLASYTDEITILSEFR